MFLQHYFLSHFHSDHTIGLDWTFAAGTIYCSAVTAALERACATLFGCTFWVGDSTAFVILGAAARLCQGTLTGIMFCCARHQKDGCVFDNVQSKCVTKKSGVKGCRACMGEWFELYRQRGFQT